MGILIAFLVMLAVAVIAGVLLTVFSHFFAVPENPQKKLIRELGEALDGECYQKKKTFGEKLRDLFD